MSNGESGQSPEPAGWELRILKWMLPTNFSDAAGLEENRTFVMYNSYIRWIWFPTQHILKCKNNFEDIQNVAWRLLGTRYRGKIMLRASTVLHNAGDSNPIRILHKGVKLK
jgi:hypothetical protein